jgi:predicted AAA+ superfamily ATPase
MWIRRDFGSYISNLKALPIKVLRGPRQVGKTSFLEKLGTHTVVYLDDTATRTQAMENPRFFLDNLPNNTLLDEAPLAPQLFPELKRRVDEQRRNRDKAPPIDYWITSSNQTLLRKEVRESLAGRATYFDLNTLSINELGERWNLTKFLISGGWPELWITNDLNPVRYLNDLISTFIEKDIVSAAGIERKQAFTKVLQLCAGRIGQLLNASDIARTAGVDVTTVQSWITILEDNGIIRSLSGYYTNVNTRLTKASKLYLEDVGLATRLQGWTDVQPLTLSPVIGNLLENIAINEVLDSLLTVASRQT